MADPLIISCIPFNSNDLQQMCHKFWGYPCLLTYSPYKSEDLQSDSANLFSTSRDKRGWRTEGLYLAFTLYVLRYFITISLLIHKQKTRLGFATRVEFFLPFTFNVAQSSPRAIVGLCRKWGHLRYEILPYHYLSSDLSAVVLTKEEVSWYPSRYIPEKSGQAGISVGC